MRCHPPQRPRRSRRRSRRQRRRRWSTSPYGAASSPTISRICRRWRRQGSSGSRRLCVLPGRRSSRTSKTAFCMKGCAGSANWAFSSACTRRVTGLRAITPSGYSPRGALTAGAWTEARPPAAELEAIQRALFLAARAGCRLHIVHMTLPEGAEMIQESKAAGQPVTVETCAHYLTLTDDDLVRLGPVAKCAPPLRDRATQEGLWQDVLQGRIDCLTSDHSPCPTEDKTRGDEDIWQAWGGISGVQTLVPLMLSEGVHRRGMTLPQFATLLSATPAKIAGLWPHKGGIQIGADADLLVIDMNREWVVQRVWLQSRHKHSPFVGRTMKGWIDLVLRRGETGARDGEGYAGGGGGGGGVSGGEENQARAQKG